MIKHIFNIVAILSLVFVFTGCGGDAATANDTGSETTAPRSTTNKNDAAPATAISPKAYGAKSSFDFREGFDRLVPHYEQIALRLANDDLVGMKENVMPFVNKMSGLDKSEINVEGHRFFTEQNGILVKNINALNTAPDLVAARVAFYDLSNAMVELAKNFGTNRDALYIINSPEAFNGSSAKWLSYGTEIKNPYFGGENISNGEIEETLTANQ